ncbi:MAG: triose-phosphate isomerase [Candidatus Omnitrophica bacterium]|nr:triose-phosphate isomerase [Candidatus Omnitrophota bacterium]
MRKPIIAGNWKMNKTISDAIELVNGLKRNLYKIEDVDIVVCPPSTVLSDTAEVLMDSNIHLGGQNIFWEEKGAFTGEVSAVFLKDLGCRYVIVGHSERRQYFGETNEGVNKKTKTALRTGLFPIVCVGEKLNERESGKTFDVIKDHVTNGLKDINGKEILNCVVAYEPVWAIGTGKTATPQQAEEVHKFIRGLLLEMYSKEISSSIRLQYGGSVTPENISSLMEMPDIDGALVGGASLKVDSFSEIVRKSSEVKKRCTYS